MSTVYNLGLNSLTDGMIAMLQQSGMVTPATKDIVTRPVLPIIRWDDEPLQVRRAVVNTLDKIEFEEGDVCVISAPSDVAAYVALWFNQRRAEGGLTPLLITPLGRFDPVQKEYVVRCFREVVFDDKPDREPCHIL